MGISNKSNDHEDSSVSFKSFLGQDIERNGDNSLRQINLKDLDADSPNNTLNQETCGQKVALKNNIEEGSNNYSLELDKKPEVSLSESRNYGAIKKFVAGDSLQVDRNSQHFKDSRNFGKIRNGRRNQGSTILLRHLMKRMQSNMIVPKNGYERRAEYLK